MTRLMAATLSVGIALFMFQMDLNIMETGRSMDDGLKAVLLFGFDITTLMMGGFTLLFNAMIIFTGCIADTFGGRAAWNTGNFIFTRSST